MWRHLNSPRRKDFEAAEKVMTTTILGDKNGTPNGITIHSDYGIIMHYQNSAQGYFVLSDVHLQYDNAKSVAEKPDKQSQSMTGQLDFIHSSVMTWRSQAFIFFGHMMEIHGRQ